MTGNPRNYESQPHRKFVRDSRTGEIHPNLAYRERRGPEAHRLENRALSSPVLRKVPPAPATTEDMSKAMLGDPIEPKRSFFRRSPDAKVREENWASLRRIRNAARKGKDNVLRLGQRVTAEEQRAHDSSRDFGLHWKHVARREKELRAPGSMKNALCAIARSAQGGGYQVGWNGVAVPGPGGEDLGMQYDPDEDVYRRSDGATAKATRRGKEVTDWKKLRWVGPGGLPANRFNPDELGVADSWA